MKNFGSVLLFVALGVLAQGITLFLIGSTPSFLRALLGFGYAAVLFIFYRLAMDEHNFFADELRSYAVRKQSSNRLSFALVASIGLLPMNVAVFLVDPSKLLLIQMVSVMAAVVLTESARKSWARYTYKADCKTKSKTFTEVTNKDGKTKLCQVGNSIGI